MPTYPITFSIPSTKIVTDIPNKIRVLSEHIPGNRSTYHYNTETEYYKQYQESVFALTTQKAGWDCLRHYEIMANGCIPVFYGIDCCPKNTLSLFPKSLLLECIEFYEEYRDDLVQDIPYTDLITRLLDYTRNTLTTTRIAEYVLQTVFSDNNNTNDQLTPYASLRVLFLSGSTEPDYLRCLTLHGFKTLLHERCHEYPKIDHLYISEECNECKSNTKPLYGRGITYTNLLDDNQRDLHLDSTIDADVCAHKYDLVVYGNCHRGMPKYDLVKKYYTPTEVLLLCGEDIHQCKYYDYGGHNVFVREFN